VPSIVQHARTIIASGAKMLSLGGDHFITYPLLRAHVERYGRPLSLIHFDAHSDTWADDEPDSLNHGTMFYKAIREGLVDPAALGADRHPHVERRLHGHERAGRGFCSWSGSRGGRHRVLEIVGNHPTYLTFDIDCLDPAFAPGTGTPVPGGLSSAQALDILRRLVPVDLIGMDVVEVAPAYDHAEITALSAAHIAAEMLCVLSAKRR
jgi:agmatinase